MTRFPVTVLYFVYGESKRSIVVHGLAEASFDGWMWVQPTDQTLFGSSFSVGDEGVLWIHGRHDPSSPEVKALVAAQALRGSQ